MAERLYLTCNENEILSAGILYTTGSSSDGTLGGLSSEANRDKIERIVKSAPGKNQNALMTQYVVIIVLTQKSQMAQLAMHASCCQNRVVN